MKTITYNLNEAIQAAKATLPHASKDDVTPIIMSTHLTPEAWYATDRYTLAKYTIEARDNFEPLTLPYDAIEWVSKIIVNKLRHKERNKGDYTLEIKTTTKNEILVSILWQGNPERSQAFTGITGNYPPVDRLINDWKPAQETGIEAYPVKLNPTHIEKITSYVKRAEKDAPLTIELGKPYNSDETYKPTPVRFTYGNLTALVQPNLKL